MQIRCPWCGERDLSEFTYGGDAAHVRPADPDALSDAAWFAYVYKRDNPAGPHTEFWQHLAGCRAWIKVVRDTVTHDIHATGAPQDDLKAETKA